MKAKTSAIPNRKTNSRSMDDRTKEVMHVISTNGSGNSHQDRNKPN